MSKSIRSKINKDIEEKTWRKFLSQFKKDLSSEKIEEVFNTLLSREEKIILARRLAVVFLIKQGKSYKNISRILGVSPKTISVVKKSISTRYYKPYKHNPSKNITPSPGRSFFDEIADALSKMPSYSGKGRWRFLDSY